MCRPIHVHFFGKYCSKILVVKFQRPETQNSRSLQAYYSCCFPEKTHCAELGAQRWEGFPHAPSLVQTQPPIRTEKLPSRAYLQQRLHIPSIFFFVWVTFGHIEVPFTRFYLLWRLKNSNLYLRENTLRTIPKHPKTFTALFHHFKKEHLARQVAHTFSPRTPKAKAGRSPSWKLAQYTQCVPEQPGLSGKTLPQKTKTKLRPKLQTKNWRDLSS